MKRNGEDEHSYGIKHLDLHLSLTFLSSGERLRSLETLLLNWYDLSPNFHIESNILPWNNGLLLGIAGGMTKLQLLGFIVLLAGIAS